MATNIPFSKQKTKYMQKQNNSCESFAEMEVNVIYIVGAACRLIKLITR